MKILNLYAGIGGNRRLWGNNHEITAVEFDDKVAEKYQELYPKDKVIVADAHEYLLKHYTEFEKGFIWSSPPCQTHSKANYFINYITESRYPKMELWQEIIFLKTFCKGKYVVENVKAYYEHFIPPTEEIGRHYFWANFKIPPIEQPKGEVGTMMKKYAGTDKHAHSKPLAERNMVNDELGLHILERAQGIIKSNQNNQGELF
tara:strand:- start:360 stop:968 length:609 start_codon:yes stop_codon:yes gene_type:complete